MPKKKHYQLNINVSLPGVEEPLTIPMNSSLKIRNLKQLIKEKGNLDVSLDQIQCQVEGGDMLRKL